MTSGDAMMPGQWEKAKELFLEALSQPPEQRAAFVRARDGGDQEVRNEVEAMLAAHRNDASPPAPPTAVSLSDAPAAEQSQTRHSVGRYKLLQPIGEGGMGVVYMAEQQAPVRRKVALKLIKPGMDSAAVIARFEAERQALAMMDHPNIARVFDAGAAENGRPYFVMELVQGVPITRYCDQQQLTPRQRLELFVPVCQAVQHAHQKGIIHRDLKPSNILITICDGKPMPKIIDFGVAKALHQQLTEKTLFTRFGAAVGTLEYMSPEQTDLDLMGTDTRSDIYSLGVILYELLAGSTPLEGKRLREAGYEQMLRTIREEEPPKPSTRLGFSGDALASISMLRKTEPQKLIRLVSGDLDWISMKCLEKDRSRRYETASALARDIERYLSDEPVEASPPSATYRLRKLGRRYRVPLRIATSFAVLLVVATVVSGWQAVRATRAKSAAVISNAAAVEAQKKTALQRDLVVQQQRQTQLKLAEALVLRGDVSMLADRPDDALADYCQAQDLFRALGADSRRAELALWTFYRRYPPPLNVVGTADGTQPTWPPGRELALANVGRAGLFAIDRADEPPDTLSLRDLTDGHEITSFRVGDMPAGYIRDGPVAAASRDYRKLLIGCPDGKVMFWPTGGKPARELGQHHGSVRAVAISPDGRWGISGGDDHLLKLWDLPGGRNLCSLLVSDMTEGVSLALSPDGQMAGIRPNNPGHLTLLSLPEGKPVIQEMTRSSLIRPIHFSDDGRFALLLESEKLICFDLKAGRVLQVLAAEKSASGEDDDLRHMAMCPDGRTVVVSSATSTKLWDCITGQISSSRPGEFVPPAVSPDGRRLAYAQGDRLRVEALDTGRRLLELREVPSLKGASYASAEWTGPDVVVGGAQVAKYTDWRAGRSSWRETIWNAEPDPPQIRAGAGASRLVSVSDDGELLAACDEKTVRVWDVLTGHELRRFTEADSIRSLAFSTDGKSLLVAAQKPAVKQVTPQGVSWKNGAGTLSEWDLLEGRRISHLESPGLYMTRDGRTRIVTVGEPKSLSFGSPVKYSVQDAKTGRELYTGTASIEELLGALTMTDSFPETWLRLFGLICGDAWETKADPGVDFFPFVVDPRTIAFPDQEAINVYDRASGRPRMRLQIPSHSLPRPPEPDDQMLRAMSIAPDGRLLFVGMGTELWVWDVDTGRKLYSLRSRSGNICSVAFSRTGHVAGCGTEEGTIEVLDFSRANRYREFASRIDRARRAIRANPKDVEALATFGQWYAFRGKWDWAIEYLESARANGRDISPLTLARWYLALNKADAAHREFQRAIEKGEAPDTYLRICLAATALK